MLNTSNDDICKNKQQTGTSLVLFFVNLFEERYNIGPKHSLYAIDFVSFSVQANVIFCISTYDTYLHTFETFLMKRGLRCVSNRGHAQIVIIHCKLGQSYQKRTSLGYQREQCTICLCFCNSCLQLFLLTNCISVGELLVFIFWGLDTQFQGFVVMKFGITDSRRNTPSQSMHMENTHYILGFQFDEMWTQMGRKPGTHLHCHCTWETGITIGDIYLFIVMKCELECVSNRGHTRIVIAHGKQTLQLETQMRVFNVKKGLKCVSNRGHTRIPIAHGRYM